MSHIKWDTVRIVWRERLRDAIQDVESGYLIISLRDLTVLPRHWSLHSRTSVEQLWRWRWFLRALARTSSQSPSLTHGTTVRTAVHSLTWNGPGNEVRRTTSATSQDKNGGASDRRRVTHGCGTEPTSHLQPSLHRTKECWLQVLPVYREYPSRQRRKTEKLVP